MNARQRILLEHAAAREKAEALLQGLMAAKASAQRVAPPINGGREGSGIDSAIRSTRRLVEAYTRTLDAFREDLSEADMELLDDER
jgi:hypothetical protein